MADVELSESDLNVERSEALENSGKLGAGGGFADDEMALETNTVNGCAGLLKDLDDFNCAVGLFAVLFEVVVVVVPGIVRDAGGRIDKDLQLGLGVGLLGGVEGNSQVVGSKGLVKDTVAPLAAVVDSLVDDVPGVAVTLVVLDNIGNVRLDDLGQFRSRELASRDYNC